jgi:drug/metabolite transporter (DMT)-like permease
MNKNTGIHVAVIVIASIAANLGVTLLLQQRSMAAWIIGMLVFIGVPWLIGYAQDSMPDRATNLMIALIVACAFVYGLTDPLASQYEQLRDAFFLLTGITVITVAANRTRHYAQAGNLSRAGPWLLVALAGVFGIALLFLLLSFLE